MKRRNFISRMLAGIAGLFGVKAIAKKKISDYPNTLYIHPNDKLIYPYPDSEMVLVNKGKGNLEWKDAPGSYTLEVNEWKSALKPMRDDLRRRASKKFDT